MDAINVATARVAVVGHGSWATALVKILVTSGSQVDWYVRNDEVRENLAAEGTNPRYLSNVHFCMDRITLHNDVAQAVAGAQIVLLATPSAFLESVLEPLDPQALQQKFVISAIKGIVPDGYLTIAEYVNQKYGVKFDQIGIISGPCHAEEVALERLSYLTMVCKNEELAKEMGQLFNTKFINVTTSTDIYGVEYAAVLKNIYAIAVGMCHALGYGDNFTAVIIANAAREMEAFMKTTYPSERDICRSVYLGDLLVTCYSQFSRNRTFGLMIGKGYSVKNAQMEMNMIAEGYYATACIKKVLERCDLSTNLRLPIAEAMYAVLYEKKSPKQQLKNILTDLK